MAPLLGGLIGTLVYDTFFFTGSESILNRPLVFSHRRSFRIWLTFCVPHRDTRARRAHAHALAAERSKPGVPGVEIV